MSKIRTAEIAAKAKGKTTNGKTKKFKTLLKKQSRLQLEANARLNKKKAEAKKNHRKSRS